METNIAKRGALTLLLTAALTLACAIFATPAVAHADEPSDQSAGIEPTPNNEYHISSANELLACVALSRERDTSNWKVYLDCDLQLGDKDMQDIVNSTVKHLSFGNKDFPFRGTFDGQNHTVTGLKYANNVLDPERDTGFFAETSGATIKNFLVKDADIWADFRGGIIAGRAVNTTFENVMVMESTLHVTCANNMLNVITNAGFEGGMIAGELDGCNLYNCEVRGGRAVHNTTAGVQAIGGEGLYMAAFAGYVKNSTIEYCRVTPTRNEDGSSMDMTDVTNKYDVAIGALGGNNVYASGFVGCMAEGAKVIDCFSTAECYSYAASYVGVISVTRAWTGGLAGRILSKSGNEITRSHFAGDLSSRQYNPIAVIPIIQNDVNLGGIGARANMGDATITDCYFKPSVSLSGFSQGTAAKKTIYALAGDGTVSGAGFGPWDDERYITRELWEQHDYDFCAGTMRTTVNDSLLGGQHANEWAMDYKLNIPVHGKSVKTTIDFPGAGMATVLTTMLGKDQSTSDPYTFAVSAVLAGTAQGLATGDTSVTFKQTTSDKPAGLTDANDGYRFMGWFREPEVHVNRIDADNSWFDGKTDEAAIKADKQVEENVAHDTLKAYSHNVKNDTGADTLKNVLADTDFPGSGTLDDTWVYGALKFAFAPSCDRYSLNFWTLERQDGKWTLVGNPVKSDIHINSQYKLRAMVTTMVGFYGKDGAIKKDTTRRYESQLLQSQVDGKDPVYTYKYPFFHTDKVVDSKPEGGKTGDVNPYLTLESSPTDAEMAVPGYKFLGWISTAEVQKDSAVWNYIYDVNGDSFTTSDPSKAAPYLATDASTVTQWQDAYPVYAKYDVKYTTNLHRAGFEGTDKVNVPRYDIAPVINADTDPATATVTPDVTTPVYKAGGELYKLQKVEIELPNGEVKVLDSAGNNSYSYPVEPNGAYTFVAHYTPLAVVYHLNASEVDGKVAQQGDMLGNLNGGIPKPTYDVSTIDEHTGAFNVFVGWTEAQPAPGKGYVAWSEGIHMVSASTVVKAPMELYPVYRPSLVAVQSNIDSNLANPDSVRGLGRTDSGDQISLEVKAAEEVVGIDGTKYDFVGWSRDYVDNNSYTLMTGDKTYFLDGNEPFREVTYTAIYKPTPLKVRYHDTEGNVIYTATVDPNDAEELRDQDGNAGFVQTVEVPKMDESGNPVYDDKGEPVMESKEVAYDPDAYSAIVAFLDERADSSLKELFLEWQWVNGDTAVAWNDFKGNPVKANMDLYPVTYQVVASDTSDAANTKNVTGQLKWLLDPNAANTVDDKSDKAPFKACFAKPFMGTQLTVHVDRVGYGLSGQTPAPVNEKYVSLYSSGSGEGSFDLTNRLDFKLTGADAQGAGNAVFDFAATHTLKIVKQTQDSWAKGKTFRFKISRADMDGNALEERKVEVTVSPDAQRKDGATWYSGAIELAVPAGIYTVEEDSAWAWRYSNQIGVPGKQPGDKAQAIISAASSANDATFTCTNARVKDKWIDGSDRVRNVWSNGNVAKKED